MKKILSILLGVLALSIPATLCFAKEDAKDCKDHPLLTRMPDYWIQKCELKEFYAYEFNLGNSKKTKVEGQYTRIQYQPPSNLTTKPSELQLVRNVENALKQIGGKVAGVYNGVEVLTLTKEGKEFWIEVFGNSYGAYGLTIVQKDAMAQEITANADAFANGLKTTGHITVEGIYFDTGKASLKPESQQAIGEVVKLLKSDAGLKVFVVGHTDNAGALDGNMKLSQERAQSVVQELVRSGINAARLKAYGNGPYSPVASNDAEDGRAKNRRVELVKQ